MLRRTVKLKRYFVEVIWHDANRIEEWTDPDNIPKVVECRTRGWVVYKDDTQIVVAGTIAEDGDMLHVIAIPQGMIQAVKNVKIPK